MEDVFNNLGYENVRQADRTADEGRDVIIVTGHIVDEAETRLKKQASMRNAASFLTTLDKSTVCQFEAIPEAVFDDAKATFVEWTDLDASLINFVVAAPLDELAVDHILTYDRHYDTFDVTTLPYHNQS